MKRIFLIFFFLFLTLSLAAGCGNMKNEASSARRIRDDRGYSFSVSTRPSRIVSLTYGTDEILLGLVDTDRVEALSGYAGNADITFVTPAERDAVGRTVDFNVETILALKPDLVIASTAVPGQVVSLLRQSGIPVYVSRIPATWEEMETKVLGVAKAVNEEDRGRQMVNDMEAKKGALKTKLASITPDRERTALALSFRGILGKKGTLFSEILAMAHVKDGAARYDVPKGTNAYLSTELLPEIDPDVILMPVWEVKEGDDAGEFAEELRSNPAYQDVKAVKNGKLIPFPEKYKYVMSQHITDAMEASARAVYPELFDRG
ncbi:ABC transporter substrate-binding protein [uncultured Dialister sp.]|uniref:ABC transporter substrate-binding protein n=1 Tax=uncultured Dialister sp. TaxID=278064 RepID=UPI0026DD91A4|nr:ABC transporter substrate-binding protein [uncultured Dialister sp.]